MKRVIIKISTLFLALLFLFPYYAHGQSCNSLKEVLENSNFCDKTEVLVGGSVIGDTNYREDSNYISEFNITADGLVIKILSKDKILLFKDDEVMVAGMYYRNEEFNASDDVIVVTGKNTHITLSAEEYTDLLVNYVGKNVLRNEILERRIIILDILVPLISVGAFVGGYFLFKRKREKGISFEGYIENLFDKKEWRIEQSNAFRKLGRWIESYNNPDFVFVHKKSGKRIAIECKYKNSFPEGYEKIIWAYEDQIEYYQQFSKKQNIPVFVILGVSGRPKNPKRMFLMPLSQIKYPDVRIDHLEKFERDPKRLFSLDNTGYLV